MVKIYTFLYSKEDCYDGLLDNLNVTALDYGKLRQYQHIPHTGLPYMRSVIKFLKENRVAKQLALLIDRYIQV